MEEIEKKVAWVFILFPGIVSAGILSQIADLGEINESSVFFLCTFFTVIDVLSGYILARIALRVLPAAVNQQVVFAVCVLLVAVFVGISFGLAAEGDVLFSALRRLPFSSGLNKLSSSEPLVKLLSNNSHGELADRDGGDARPKALKVTDAFAQVGMKNGTIYEGWPEYYSLHGDTGELYLTPACVVSKNGDEDTSKKLPGPGVLVFNPDIQYMELIDKAASSCFVAWYGRGVIASPDGK